ncbi:hypothetical protein DMP23_43035 [Amycolatopsis sp. A1MSW2902]|uniref:hypothetical protein n=1 Tax=Amycolatopsis sp. A1MSW2902 TaxID=687413 RepID=UPI00307DEDE1
MTITPLDLENARRYNIASRAQLAELGAGLVPFLESGTHRSLRGETTGTLWTVWRGRPEDGGPCLLVGLRGDRGTLAWYEDGENNRFVPVGTFLGGEAREYWTGGQPVGCTEGEELAVIYASLALGEFIGTGDRPTVVRWQPASAMPDHRQPEPIEQDAAFLAWRQAAG